MVVGAVVAMLALLLVIGLLSDEGDEPPSENPPAAAEAPGEGEAREGGRQASERAEGVSLRVAPLGETYVCVEDEAGDEVFEQTIAEPETFRGKMLRVNFGNTEVDLELNGRELAVEQGANPVGFEFTADGERELPEAQRPCT